MYVKAFSKADLLLDNNLSVIAKMDCSDAPKPIENAFLRPSIIFFPTVFINYIYKYIYIYTYMYINICIYIHIFIYILVYNHKKKRYNNMREQASV